MDKILNATKVRRLTKPGRHADGGNLHLFIKRTPKGTLSKCWTFKYEKGGRVREMGLGRVATVSLAAARGKAAKARTLLDQGIDPLAVKGVPVVTFQARANAFIEARGTGWNKVHLHQWRKSIDDYLEPLANMPVADVDTTAVLGCLTPLWQKIPSTASRLRGKIEAVLDSATALGLRSGPNPAAWRGHLALILPTRSRGRIHHAAMDYAAVPGFMRELRGQDSVAAWALEFVILTACRSGEVRFATWSEIDLGAGVWTIPAARMKAGREHRVPLSDRAIEILDLAMGTQTGLIFAGQRRGAPICKTAMGELVPAGATVHGFRSSFRDWAGNETCHPREIAEQALVHATGNAVETAYRRGDALTKRRALMEAWASYCDPEAAENVVPIRMAI